MFIFTVFTVKELIGFVKCDDAAGPFAQRAVTWWRVPAWVGRSTAWSTLMAASQTRRSGAWEAGSRSGAPASANVLSPSCHPDAAEVPRNSARQVREQSDWQSDKPSHKYRQRERKKHTGINRIWYSNSRSTYPNKPKLHGSTNHTPSLNLCCCLYNFIKESPPQ